MKKAISISLSEMRQLQINNKLKLFYLFFIIPILSFGQCEEGNSIIDIHTNGDMFSTAENEVCISSSEGIFNECFSMVSGSEDYVYCLEPGNYTVEITDSGYDGITCNFGAINHISIDIDGIDKFNLDCSIQIITIISTSEYNRNT